MIENSETILRIDRIYDDDTIVNLAQSPRYSDLNFDQIQFHGTSVMSQESTYIFVTAAVSTASPDARLMIAVTASFDQRSETVLDED